MATQEQYRAEAVRRGLVSREDAYGVIRARPGVLERSLPAAGQVAGGFLGSAGGVPGTIAGATAGATLGRGAQQLFRSARGESFTPRKVFGELGGEAAVTGAVETAFPLVGRLVKPVVKPFIARATKKVVRPGVENLLRFMGGIQPENTERLLTRGPKHILTRSLRARERGTRIAEEFLHNARQSLDTINREWVSVVDPLRKSPASVVSTQPIRNAAQAVESEFLGAGGPAIPGTRDVFRDVRKTLTGLQQLTAGDSIPLDTALRARQQLDDLVYTGKSRGLLSPRQSTALLKLRTSFKETIHQTFPDIAQVDEKRHILGEVLQVVEDFSPDKLSSVAKFSRMINAFENIDPAVREAVQRADSVISKATGKSMLDTIRDRAAAVAFEPTELRATRTWLINVVLGTLGFGAGGPGGALGATTLGVVLSSPRMAGKALQGIMAAGHGVKRAARSIAPVGVAELMRQKFIPTPQDSRGSLQPANR